MSKSVLYDIHCDGLRCGAWAGMSDDVTPGRTRPRSAATAKPRPTQETTT